MNQKNLKLVHKDSTVQGTEPEFLQQQRNGNIAKSKQGTPQVSDKNKPKNEWKGLFFHCVTAVSIGGVGTFFHNVLHAPDIVLVLIMVIDVLYILEVMKRIK